MTAADVLTQLPRTPFPAGERTLMRAYVRNAERTDRYAFDVRPLFEGEAGLFETLRNGVIHLRSKNFGYDFMLVNVNVGTGLFGAKKSATRVYRSHLGADDYTELQLTPNLAKALALVDRMYREAAEQHLP